MPGLTPVISYSKIATDQMSKMGFVVGAGLGLKNAGRIAPIDPVEDLGGRATRGTMHYGLGFTGHNESAEPEPEPAELEQSKILMAHQQVMKELLTTGEKPSTGVGPDDTDAETNQWRRIVQKIETLMLNC